MAASTSIASTGTTERRRTARCSRASPISPPAAVVAQGGEFFVAGTLLVRQSVPARRGSASTERRSGHQFRWRWRRGLAGVATGALGGNFTADGLAIQPQSGGLIVLGTLYGNSTSSAVLVRFTAAGLDTVCLAGDGIVDLPGRVSNCTAIATQSDDTIVAAGDTNSQAGMASVAAPRQRGRKTAARPSAAPRASWRSGLRRPLVRWHRRPERRRDRAVRALPGRAAGAGRQRRERFRRRRAFRSRELRYHVSIFQRGGVRPQRAGHRHCGLLLRLLRRHLLALRRLRRFTTTGLPLHRDGMPVALTSPANPATFGQAVTLTATLPDALLATGPSDPRATWPSWTARRTWA